MFTESTQIYLTQSKTMVVQWFCWNYFASLRFVRSAGCVVVQSWTKGCELFFGSPLFNVEISVMYTEKLARSLFIFFSHSSTLNNGEKKGGRGGQKRFSLPFVQDCSCSRKYLFNVVNIHVSLMCWFPRYMISKLTLALSWPKSISYRNQSLDFLCKSMDWFLYDRDLRHKKVKMEKWNKNTNVVLVSLILTLNTFSITFITNLVL